MRTKNTIKAIADRYWQEQLKRLGPIVEEHRVDRPEPVKKPRNRKR